MLNKSDEKKVRIWLGVAVGLIVLVFALFFFQFPDNSDADFVFTEADSEGYVAVKGYTGNAKKLTIPSTDGKGHEVRYIDKLAFGSHYSVLEKVIIPDTVVQIGEYAFADCPALETVELSANLVTIERGAFSGCVRLKSIELPDTLRTVDDMAFYGCIRLKRLYIPAGVNRIGNEAFAACESLLLDVSDNAVASEYAFANNIETGRVDRTSVYLLIIFASTVVLLAVVAFVWHILHRKVTERALPEGAQESQGVQQAEEHAEENDEENAEENRSEQEK